MRMIGRAALHTLRYLAGWDGPATQTTEAERQALAEHAAGRRRAIEIGVFEGFNTELIARELASDGRLFAIDPFLPGKLGFCWSKVIARRQISRAGLSGRVTFVRAMSWDACAQLNGDFDFMFIDGDHSWGGIERDWRDWSGRVSPGGIMALHDTRVPEHNPAVAELGSCAFYREVIRHDSRFELVGSFDSLNVLRRLTG
jgi:predicted O-methyltransferase YrrM